MAQQGGRLEGKVAIITGASTGCGPVMAKLFVEQGARVLLAARREELVVEAARDAGGGSVGMRADVTNEDDIRAMVDRAMEEFGQVDILLATPMLTHRSEVATDVHGNLGLPHGCAVGRRHDQPLPASSSCLALRRSHHVAV